MNDSDWAAHVRDLRNVDDVNVMVDAAQRLHRTATREDVPRLRSLLKDDSFFVREAAAWPLTELAGAAALPELFEAYQRGFDEGHDNDGFSAALIELVVADPRVRGRSWRISLKPAILPCGRMRPGCWSSAAPERRV